MFNGGKTLLDAVLCPAERAIYRLAGVEPDAEPDAEMDWKAYTFAFVVFGLLGILALFLILMFQAYGPWVDAAHQNTPMTADLARNTAISFATTTTWQAYGGETTMSYAAQAMGLTVQNFRAGAGGLAALALAGAFAEQKNRPMPLGNLATDTVLFAALLIGTIIILGGLNYLPAMALGPIADQLGALR